MPCNVAFSSCDVLARTPSLKLVERVQFLNHAANGTLDYRIPLGGDVDMAEHKDEQPNGYEVVLLKITHSSFVNE